MNNTKIISKNIQSNTFYLVLITVIWLIVYIICQLLFEQKLGWDEVSYLTAARGIAEDFDFSSRTTTVMGLIKYAFPQHTHHYPLLSIYYAIFFKLFGVSLKVAYFATWFSGLITCIFVFLILLIMLEDNKFLSFILAISFLFLPRIINQCDSAMMEIPGCALISLLTFFVFRDLLKGKLNPVLLAIAAMWLYFYKSLFLGIIVGFLALILITYSSSLIYLNFLIYIGGITILYFIFTKFVFLPLAPMMNFHTRQEGLEGPYADFAGGFFSDVFGNIKINLIDFYNKVICRYFPINFIIHPEQEKFYTFSPDWHELGIYLLVFFYVVIFSIFLWSKLKSLQKAFILFTVTSITAFNIIFILISTASINLLCRYNLIYLPLLLISFGIILYENLEILKPFVLKYGKASYYLILSFLSILYIPYYISSSILKIRTNDVYHNFAHLNSEIVKNIVGNSSPKFIYFNTGTHTTWDLYPTRVILMEATNEQIKKLNLKLPTPIEYLFLNFNDNLFKINKDLILKGLPIIDNYYTLHRVDPENHIVVYRFRGSSNDK